MKRRKESNILYRKSHKGKDVKIYFKPYDFDSDVPSATTKAYVVWANGGIVLKTDNLKSAEDTYTAECKKHYDDVHGRFVVGRHAIKGGIIKVIESDP